MGHPEWYCGWATRHPGWWEHNRCRPPAEEPVLSLPKDEAPSSEEYAKMWVISRFKRFLHFFSKSEWVNVFLTSVIAAMSVVGTFLVIQGGKDTARIRDAAEKQACAANKSAQASRLGMLLGNWMPKPKPLKIPGGLRIALPYSPLMLRLNPPAWIKELGWVQVTQCSPFLPPNRLKLKSP